MSNFTNLFVIIKSLLVDSAYSSISNDSILLYILMLDRRNLSAKNNWLNKNGEIYIKFTIENAKEILKIGKNKAIGMFRELEEAHLITRKKMGCGRPDQIVVHDPVGLENKPAKFKNQTPEVYKKGANQTEKNNTKFINLSDARAHRKARTISRCRGGYRKV